MDILDICADLNDTKFETGSALLVEGETSDRLFVLKSGTVAVMRDETEVARSHSPGAIFGEISALTGIPATATVVAATDIHVWVVESAGELIRLHPLLARHLAQLVADRLVETTRQFVEAKKQLPKNDDQFGQIDDVLETLLQKHDRWSIFKK